MTKPFAALAAGLMLILAAPAATAQTSAPAQAAAPTIAGLDGDWNGTLDAGAAGKLRLIFHIKTDAHGTTGAVDSLDQGADGLPMSKITRDGDKVRLELDVVQGAFDGALGAGGQTLTGQWSQGGGTMPLVLTRKAAGG
jgi:hypothetical protein